MTAALPRSTQRSRKRVRKLTPIKPARADALNYYNQLNALNKGLIDTTTRLQEMASNGATGAQMADELEASYRVQIQKYTAFSAGIASTFVESLSDSNKVKVEKTIASALGVSNPRTIKTLNAKIKVPSDTFKFGADAAAISSVTPSIPFGSINSVMIFDDPGIVRIVQAAILENTQLIRTIAPHSLSMVAQAVSASLRGEEQLGGLTLVKRLQRIGDITDSRARFIARDQTAKVTSDLTKSRHEAVGIKKYIWRNSRDERVVGNPSGLYPKGNKGHGNHWIREGKIFSYDKPPSDGNPGRAYNCRCTAEAFLDLDDLDAVFGV